jgi:adenylate cyclase
MSGRFDAAADDVEKALSFARRRKAGLESEARLLTDLASAYRLAGDLDRAERTVTEAIEVASARAARVSECLARLVHVEVLLQANRAEPAGLELRKVRALIEETGAGIYENLARDLSARAERSLAGALGLDRPLAPRWHNDSCA